MSRSGCGTAIDRLFQAGKSGGSNCSIRRNRVLIGRADRHGGRFHSTLLKFITNLCILLDIEVKHWKFDTVKAPRLQAAQQWKVLFGDSRRPEQKIHAIFHQSDSFGGKRELHFDIKIGGEVD